MQPVISITTIGGLIAGLLVQQLIRYVPEGYNLAYTIVLTIFLAGAIMHSLSSQIKDLFTFRTISKHGIKSIHENMHDCKIVFDEAESKGELKILDTYIPSYPTWLERMAEALKRDVRIKILVIKPDSNVANLRADEIGGEYERKSFNDGVRHYVQQITKKALTLGDEKKNLEMRYYDDLPCVPMYILKNPSGSKMYFSFFLSKASFTIQHIELIKNRQDSLLDAFENYFDKKWQRNEANKILIGNS